MDITSRIGELAAPAAVEAGLVLETVTVSAAGKRSRVLVTVDLPATELGAASLDQVAEASRRIGAALDLANVPSTPYVLEVSTPGTDRPLTERHHFMRARTRLVDLTVGGEHVTGRLVDVEGGVEGGAEDVFLVLERDASAGDPGTVRVPLADVSRAHIVVELNRAGE